MTAELADYELLELAAKAAGLKIDKSSEGGMANTGFDMSGNAVLDWDKRILWNPLADDADALRLAVKLDLNIHPKDLPGRACCTDGGDICVFEDWSAADKSAATRRAIVRAAAEIGRQAP